MEKDDLITLSADIVAAHVSNNSVAVNDLPQLIANVHGALSGLVGPAEPEKPVPIISARASVKHDYIVCMECGSRQKMLKRHLDTQHGLTPLDYREKWGLSADYPMVAPDYAEQRRDLAHKIGLGKKGRAAKRRRTLGVKAA